MAQEPINDQDIEDVDHEDVELDAEEHAQIDAMERSIENATGDATAAEALAATIRADIAREVVAHAETAAAESGELVDEAEVNSAFAATLTAFREALDKLSDGIGAIELPEISVDATDDAAAIAIPAGTYELVTVKTLTGERRRRAMAILGNAGLFTLRVGRDVVSYMAAALSVLTGDEQVELLGCLYRRADGRKLTAAECNAVGRELDEMFNLEHLAGIVNRFFSSSAFGQEAGILASLSQLSSQAMRWLNTLEPGN